VQRKQATATAAVTGRFTAVIILDEQII